MGVIVILGMVLMMITMMMIILNLRTHHATVHVQSHANTNPFSSANREHLIIGGAGASPKIGQRASAQLSVTRYVAFLLFGRIPSCGLNPWYLSTIISLRIDGLEIRILSRAAV